MCVPARYPWTAHDDNGEVMLTDVMHLVFGAIGMAYVGHMVNMVDGDVRRLEMNLVENFVPCLEPHCRNKKDEEGRLTILVFSVEICRNYYTLLV